MTGELLLNSGVNLVVGVALWWVWRQDRRQRFAYWLGASFVVQALSAPAFLAWQTGTGVVSSLGLWTLLVAAALSLAGWMIGAAWLAGRPLSRRATLAGAVGLVFIGAGALAWSPCLAQSVGATLMTLSASVALAWLWHSGRHERIVGVTMVLLGLNQFIWVVEGNAGIPWQVGMASVLRVALGLVLVHAAVSRRGGETDRLRDQFSHLIDRSHQGLAVMQGEEMKYANPALLRIYGLPAEGGSEVAALQHWRDSTIAEADRAVARERHRRIVSGEIAQDHWEGERYSFDGRTLRLRFSAWRVEWDGRPAEQIVVTDDTARHDAMQTLLYQATHDELTGLPNRSALLQRLRELCASGQPFALLVLDVDRFKLFNEAHGPTVGDEVLRALAAALATRFAGQADVMRLGEDEFALLAVASDAGRGGAELATGVRQLLGQPFTLPQHHFFVDLSMGIALHPASAVTPEALLRSAHAAMHEAKRTPGTSVQVAEERFARGSGATLAAEQALRAGIDSDAFFINYQPKVDACTHALVGFEALARWDRPGVGRVEPTEFIPAAERTGLIGALGRLILDLACRQIAQWRQRHARMVPVAVNVSPLQLLDPGFPNLVVDTLRRHDVPAALLTLEITESAAVADMDQAREQIRQMRAHGIEVALDDFGTGFSSLNMLRSLPLSTVKIDRSLIDPMPASDATAVVKAICDLAAVLRIEVVAEGVETAMQADAAQGAGCKVLQGFFYAHPLEPDVAERWLRCDAGTPSSAGGRAWG